jgi:uncharacterized membrane protein
MIQLNSRRAAFQIAAGAIFAALVFVATYSFPINIPATSGYFNLGETIIYTGALLFGPLTGALSGGIGAAFADIWLGYGMFAPGTLTIKTVEGALVGFINQKLQKRLSNRTVTAAIAIFIGGSEMIAGYFLYEVFVLGYPFAAALAEVPFNIVQMIVGLVIAIPLMHAVLRVFPQLKNLTTHNL